MYHAINFRAFFGASLAMLCPKFRANKTLGLHRAKSLTALPTETKVESGRSQSKSGTSVNLSDGRFLTVMDKTRDGSNVLFLSSNHSMRSQAVRSTVPSGARLSVDTSICTLHGLKDVRTENVSSQGQNLALPGLLVPGSLDIGTEVPGRPQHRPFRRASQC